MLVCGHRCCSSLTSHRRSDTCTCRWSPASQATHSRSRPRHRLSEAVSAFDPDRHLDHKLQREISLTIGFSGTCLRAVAGLATSLCLQIVPPALADFKAYDHAALQRADMSNMDLTFVIFAACDCRQINLSGSNCDGSTDTFANFELGNLENSSWVRALADRVVFIKANLRNVDFTNAVLPGSLFDGADITGADFTDAVLDRAQVKRMCARADGVNSKTGVSTRESLLCP